MLDGVPLKGISKGQWRRLSRVKGQKRAQRDRVEPMFHAFLLFNNYMHKAAKHQFVSQELMIGSRTKGIQGSSVPWSQVRQSRHGPLKCVLY